MSQPRDPYRGQVQRPYQQAYPPQPPRYAPPPRPIPPKQRRIPGLGLVLTLLGLVIQVLSLTVLPWVGSASMPQLWDLATDFPIDDFGAWYVVLLGYPLAALGVLLAFATILDSVALKVIWGGLALAGLGVLVLRFGYGTIVEDTIDLGPREIIAVVVAIGAAVGVIFVLKAAMSMFRRVAGLILLGIAGVQVVAVIDLVRDADVGELGIGAFGPAAGSVLLAVAAFTAPRRIPGV